VSEFSEMLESIDPEYLLDHQGIDYRVTHGSRGTQLNLHECPFCGGSSWKVYMNAEEGLGNCFHGNCGITFNLYQFIKEFTGATEFRQVVDFVKIVARDQGWRPKKKTNVAVEEQESGVVLPPCYEMPTEDGQNLQYLADRNISNDLTAYFHLKYCHKGMYRFQKPDGKEGWQKYDERVIIPVYDLAGTLVTFQGRDLTGRAEKKYLFPSGLPGTARFLYNGHNAWKAKRVVAGEGAFDIMAIKRAFDPDIDLRDVVPIGTFGKHLSFGDKEGLDQIGALRQLKGSGLQEITFMWDGEYKAYKAAIEACKLCWGVGLRTRMALLPQDCDPDEITPEEVRKAFYQAKPVTRLSAVSLLLNNPYKKSD
jgi:DNA primase